MNKNIHTASGAYKRKLKQIKEEAHLETVKKTRKLDHFFIKTTPVPVPVPSTSTAEVAYDQTTDELADDSNNKGKRNQNKLKGIVCNPEFNLLDPNTWSTSTSDFIDYIIRNLPKHCSDIKDYDFSRSKREYADKVRVAKEHMLFTRLPNGEVKKREWLMYSNSKGCFYCVPCKLFQPSENQNSFSKGFNDWKNSSRLSEHERSAEHRFNTKTFVVRANVMGKIDSALHENYVKEVDYWHRVLKRVVDVVKFLGTRGLAFRGGSKEIFGSLGNGNFMGALELLAEYDDFLKTHIETRGNPGSGRVSYLSKTICDEFIELMYKKVVCVIVKQLKKSKYYSLSVDSTPDITHSDQLTVIVRYVLSDGSPVERFLSFIKLKDHTGAHMENIVLNTLSELDIAISDMRGQSYDNASNMSGKYNGLQALIKKHNSLAEYLPCSGHSLNLVGTHAADCCLRVTKLFMFVQEIYVFLSASTSRWAVVEAIVEDSEAKKKLLPKRLNTTRWAARWHAVRALVLNYWSYHDAFRKIADNPEENNTTKAEASGICQEFSKLETALLLHLWYDILQRLNQSSETLQKITTDLSVTCSIYKSLRDYVLGLRNNYDAYERKGKELSKTETYVIDIGTKRKPKRKVLPGENTEECVTDLNGKEDMKINTFYVIIDRLSVELHSRSEVYFRQNEVFGFLINLSSISNDEIRNKASALAKKYPSDISDDFGEECVHFKEFIKDIDLFEEEDKNLEEEEAIRNVPLAFLKLIRDKQLTTLFPNLDTALRILLCMMTSNASGERSFSILKRVKDYLRNSSSESRLSSLASFVANAELFKDLDFDDLVKEFSSQKARKVDV